MVDHRGARIHRRHTLLVRGLRSKNNYLTRTPPTDAKLLGGRRPISPLPAQATVERSRGFGYG